LHLLVRPLQRAQGTGKRRIGDHGDVEMLAQARRWPFDEAGEVVQVGDLESLFQVVGRHA
jgi:hypothetical protein